MITWRVMTQCKYSEVFFLFFCVFGGEGPIAHISEDKDSKHPFSLAYSVLWHYSLNAVDRDRGRDWAIERSPHPRRL